MTGLFRSIRPKPMPKSPEKWPHRNREYPEPNSVLQNTANHYYKLSSKVMLYLLRPDTCSLKQYLRSPFININFNKKNLNRRLQRSLVAFQIDSIKLAPTTTIFPALLCRKTLLTEPLSIFLPNSRHRFWELAHWITVRSHRSATGIKFLAKHD